MALNLSAPASDPVPADYRYEHTPDTAVSVTSDGRTVIVSMAHRADFDAIQLPCREYRGELGHVLIKALRQRGPDLDIVFHYWLLSLTRDAIMARIHRGDR